MSIQKNERLWLTWEDHRRSRELAAAFDAEYMPLCAPGSRMGRYAVLSFRTLRVLFRIKPELLFVQNPSIVLASIACMLKPVLCYQLVIDRHSNFKFATRNSTALIWSLFHFLSDYTVKTADLTIVTIEFLRNHVEQLGGKAVVLPDRLPKMDSSRSAEKPGGEYRVVCITTFSDDEPIFELAETAKNLGAPYCLYLTGNYKNYPQLQELNKIATKNFVMTGFLDEADYQALLVSADVVVVLTTLDNLLTCGAYEAVALERPMILSNTEALRSYFTKGAIYVDNSVPQLTKAISDTVDNEGLQTEVRQLKVELSAQWQKPFDELLTRLGIHN